MPSPASTTPARLPVVLLTGFLGSGKTTLLNRLLQVWPRAAVLINEFGKTPLDHILLNRNDIPLMILSGGCLCCQIKDALAPTLKNLRMAWQGSKPSAFDRLIIECSGVASPEPVLDVLLRDRWLAARYHLQATLTTLAVPQAVEQLQRFAEARSQLAYADVVVLTHGDMADADDTAEVMAHLDTVVPATPYLSAVQGQIDPERLLQLTRISPHYRPHSGQADWPDHGFQSLSLYLEHPLPWPVLHSALERLLRGFRTVLVRIKGVVYLTGEARPQVIQVAGGRLYPPTPLPGSPQDYIGRLVIIMAGDPRAIAETLMAELGGHTPPESIRYH
jgi:G3E family GTPase